MDSENLPESPNASVDMENLKEQEKNDSPMRMILIGCGAFILVGICIIIGAVLVAGGSLFSLFQNTTAIVEYNNELVDERDKVITVLQDTSQNYFYSLEISEIEDATKSLKEVTYEVESTIDSTEVPKGAEDIKQLNKDYIKVIRDIISHLETQTEANSSVYDIPDESYTEYQDLLTKLDAINVSIAEKLNEVVGYDAVPQTEIDQLKTDLY